jgi:hypothetical protein
MYSDRYLLGRLALGYCCLRSDVFLWRHQAIRSARSQSFRQNRRSNLFVTGLSLILRLVQSGLPSYPCRDLSLDRNSRMILNLNVLALKARRAATSQRRVQPVVIKNADAEAPGTNLLREAIVLARIDDPARSKRSCIDQKPSFDSKALAHDYHHTHHRHHHSHYHQYPLPAAFHDFVYNY